MPIAIAGASTPSGLVKTGIIAPWTTAAAPNEWLLCDGSAVSRTTYAALFAIIGTTYGVGDGSTTFNVPDLRERVPVGYKAASAEFGALGATYGEKTHVLTVAELAAHTHGDVYSKTAGGGSTYITTTDTANAGSHANVSAGSDAAHNNIQPSLTLNYIIKT